MESIKEDSLVENHILNRSRFSFSINNSFLLIAIAISMCALFWNLGMHPDFFFRWVEHAIHPTVDNFLNINDTPNGITWYWTDMYQHGAYRSPVYSVLIGTGMKAFGFSLLGVRIVPTIFSFISLLMLFFAYRECFSNRFAFINIALISTAPYYLIFARSGSINSMSLSFAIIASCLTLMLVSKPRSFVIAFMAGIAVALLPYCYVIVRPIPLLLIIIVIFNVSRIKRAHLILFFIPICLIIAVQFSSPKNWHPIKLYFSAKGESMAALPRDSETGEVAFTQVVEKIADNILVIGNQLIGLNERDKFWNVDIAKSYASYKSVIYPKFLVPLFITGFILSLYEIFKVRSRGHLILLLVFGLALTPGLMAKIGKPTSVRLMLVVIPLYFYISLAVDRLFTYLNLKIKWKRQYIKRSLNSLLMLAAAGIVFYQCWNFFSYPKTFHEEKGLRASAYHLHETIIESLEENREANILVYEFGPFFSHSYTLIKLAGDRDFHDKIRSEQIVLYKASKNRKKIELLLEEDYFDLFLSSGLGIGDLKLKGLVAKDSIEVNGVKKYSLK